MTGEEDEGVSAPLRRCVRCACQKDAYVLADASCSLSHMRLGSRGSLDAGGATDSDCTLAVRRRPPCGDDGGECVLTARVRRGSGDVGRDEGDAREREALVEASKRRTEGGTGERCPEGVGEAVRRARAPLRSNLAAAELDVRPTTARTLAEGAVGASG